MMPLCKAITKQLLGARYEGAARALAAAGVLYLAVRASGWQVTVAPAVLCLSTAWYTAGVLLQQLQGRRLQDTVAALLAMPCRQRLAPVYTLTVGGCTLLTRTLPVWALFAAVGRWQPGQAAAALAWCRCLRCKARSCRWGWNGCAPSAAGRPRASSGTIPASTWSRWSCCCWARGSAPGRRCQPCWRRRWRCSARPCFGSPGGRKTEPAAPASGTKKDQAPRLSGMSGQPGHFALAVPAAGTNSKDTKGFREQTKTKSAETPSRRSFSWYEWRYRTFQKIP